MLLEKCVLSLTGSKFGAFLDMLTDRCSTMCLLVVLCNLYPRWMFVFQLSIIIDIVSHWMHCQRCLIYLNIGIHQINQSNLIFVMPKCCK